MSLIFEIEFNIGSELKYGHDIQGAVESKTSSQTDAFTVGNQFTREPMVVTNDTTSCPSSLPSIFPSSLSSIPIAPAVGSSSSTRPLPSQYSSLELNKPSNQVNQHPQVGSPLSMTPTAVTVLPRQSQNPPPTYYGPPGDQSTLDVRIRDAMELCAFAMTSLKVCLFIIFTYAYVLIIRLTVCSL